MGKFGPEKQCFILINIKYFFNKSLKRLERAVDIFKTAKIKQGSDW
jgi:hypothetical protein